MTLSFSRGETCYSFFNNVVYVCQHAHTFFVQQFLLLSLIIFPRAKLNNVGNTAFLVLRLIFFQNDQFLFKIRTCTKSVVALHALVMRDFYVDL